MAVSLRLGEVTFQNYEVPERINFGGDQALSVFGFIGGKREVHAMGRVDDDISWSGLFFGSTATERAQFIDQMRNLGKAIPLTWSQFNYLVVIKSFKCSFQMSVHIPYSITCTVIQNLNAPLNVLLPVGYNDAIQNQLTEANDLALLVSNPSVVIAMGLVTQAIQNVPSLQEASATTLAPVVASILSAQAVVGSAILATSKRVFG